MTNSSIPADEWPDPARLVCLVSLVATHGLVRLTERYLPEFISALGYGPILVGTVLTIGLGTAVAAAGRETPSLEPDIDGVSVAGLSALLVALGLLAWSGAPTLDTLLGTPVSAFGWLVVGIVLLQAWHVRGPVRRLWPTDVRIVERFSSASDRRKPIVVGALGVGGAAVVATAAVAIGGNPRSGFVLVAATGAAVAIVAAVALGTVGGEPTRSPDRSGSTGIDTGAGTEIDVGTDPERTTIANDPSSVAALWNAVTGLPDRRRWTLTGDALVRAAIVGSSPYLILLFVEHRPVALSFGDLSLAPAAAFGLFVLAEAVGAIAGTAAFPALDSGVDRHSVLTVGLAALSMLPIALLVAPASFGVVVLLFALFGCRTALEPLRPTVGVGVGTGAGVRTEDVPDAAPERIEGPGPDPDPGRPAPPHVRTAIRFALVPAPLVGGVLYAISPLAAFTLATTVGLLGVRELLRALAQKHYG